MSQLTGWPPETPDQPDHDLLRGIREQYEPRIEKILQSHVEFRFAERKPEAPDSEEELDQQG